MTDRKLPLIEVGYQVFAGDGEEEFGAVRFVAPNGRPELIIYVEGAGDFAISLDAVSSVHAQKVNVMLDRLEPRLREAIAHAHDNETE